HLERMVWYSAWWLVLVLEADSDVRVGFDRFSAQQIRRIAPLLGGGNGCFPKQRAAADHTNVLQLSIDADCGAQDNIAAHTCASRHLWVLRQYLSGQLSFDHAARLGQCQSRGRGVG